MRLVQIPCFEQDPIARLIALSKWRIMEPFLPNTKTNIFKLLTEIKTSAQPPRSFKPNDNRSINLIIPAHRIPPPHRTLLSDLKHPGQ